MDGGERWGEARKEGQQIAEGKSCYSEKNADSAALGLAFQEESGTDHGHADKVHLTEDEEQAHGEARDADAIDSAPQSRHEVSSERRRTH